MQVHGTLSDLVICIGYISVVSYYFYNEHNASFYSLKNIHINIETIKCYQLAYSGLLSGVHSVNPKIKY